MRVRLLKPETFKDEHLAEVSMAARLLFMGLWTLADREGRLEDRPKWIRAELFPYDHTLDVGALLTELSAPKPFLIRYEVDGRNIIQLTNFLKHQKPHPREIPSTLPAPRLAQGKPRLAQGAPSRAVSVSVSDSVPVSERDPVTRRDLTPDQIDRIDAELAAEEKRFSELALPIRDSIQSVLDSLPRAASRSPFSASRWLATGRTGVPRSEGGLTVLRLTCDALEARARAQGQPQLSDANRQTLENIKRVGDRMKAQQVAHKEIQ